MKRSTKRNVGAWPNMRDDTLKHIAEELIRARKKHPAQSQNLRMVQNYVSELVGTFNAYNSGGRTTAAQIYAVAATVAAMAIRVMEEGDLHSPFKGNTKAPPAFELTGGDLPPDWKQDQAETTRLRPRVDNG